MLFLVNGMAMAVQQGLEEVPPIINPVVQGWTR